MNKRKFTLKGVAAQTGLLALLVGVGCALPQQASAIGAGDADTMFNGYNSAFLMNGNYYRDRISANNFDGGWTGALDINVAEDAFERTGSAANQNLVEALATTFLQKYPPGYTWDGYNDDVGWIGAMLARAYLITGDANLLSQARSACFDMAWARGWDTQYNGGGIWEQQPDYAKRSNPPAAFNKCPLSNDSLGKTACLIYMGNHDQWYLDRATQIYAWVRTHLYNPNNGQVYPYINPDGSTDTNPADAAAYNQGTFADYANYLYQITGNIQYFNDAQKALDYVKNTMYNGGVITGGGTNTWSDEYARGLGHFCRDNRMWGTYYNWATLNANAIMSHRRTDYNICWGNFTQQTPNDNTIYTNRFDDAVTWMQYVPATMPNNIWGRHAIVGLNNMAIDSLGLTTNNSIVGLWGLNYGQTQIWDLSQNADTSWNIVSESSWLALDDPGGNTTNGTKMIQWAPSRANNQRWWVDQQADGSYKIWNQASSLALDSSSTNTNGTSLIEWGWSGQPQQRWQLR